ncbi:4'-phosphopantetheinyl transferase family protein [Anaerosporobacter faecicola]|uniref:4'-phosphopantetheinyl transferase family protein n=1 Tax=Anaerosporobacter faecicola TaxID=2718714 RepID=UPI00143BEAE5|nr:4'-phosphopantetheinyl transferase superfamily protein [Anaerosporobacter faecicola]
MSKIVLLNNCSFTKDEYNNYIRYVSWERREKLEKYQLFMDQCRGLAAALLARSMISENYRKDDREITFGVTEFGKPVCRSIPKVQFNLSHAGTYVAGIFDEHPVGIDVEQIPDKKQDQIVEEFFSQMEKDYYQKCVEKEKTFATLWTIKEAYVKYLGCGLNKELDSFTVYWEKDEIKIYDHEIHENLAIYINSMYKQAYYLASISQSKPDYIEWSKEELFTKVETQCNIIM